MGLFRRISPEEKQRRAEKKRLEKEKKAHGLRKFKSGLGRERWGEREQVRQWKRADRSQRRIERLKRIDIKRSHFRKSPGWIATKWAGRKIRGAEQTKVAASTKQPTQKIEVKGGGGKKKTNKVLKVAVILLIIWFLFLPQFQPPLIASVRQEGIDIITDPGWREKLGIYGSFFTLNWFQTEIQDIGTWRNPDAVPIDKIKKGASIRDFRPIKSAGFRENEEIIFRGNLVPNDPDLLYDLELTLHCGMIDYDGVALVNLDNNEGEFVKTTFKVDDTRYKEFKCIFPNGMEIEEGESRTVRAFVNITSDYEVKTDLLFYTIGEKEYKRYKNVIEIFSERGDLQELQRQGLWKNNGEIASKEVKSGPMKLSLGMGNQPYYGGNSELIIRLHKDFGYATGTLDKLKRLSLRLPGYTQINPRFCPYFEGRGNTVSLKQNFIDYINTCEEDCEFNKNDFRFSCEIVANVADVNQKLSKSWIKAEMLYDFEIHEYASAKIKEKTMCFLC